MKSKQAFFSATLMLLVALPAALLVNVAEGEGKVENDGVKQNSRVITVRPGSGEIDSLWLARRAEQQGAIAAGSAIFSDFRFQDRRQESGVTFRNRVVPDGGRTLKPVHYDHGNGVAIADVNGDGLHDIYFVNQVGANELWVNLGGAKFKNNTQAAGVGVASRIGVSASFADIDNDGDPDLYVTTVRHGNVLFENNGAGKFTDISEGSGLDYKGHSSGTVFFDYDRDGLLDVFVTNVGKYTSDEQVSATGNYPELQFDEEYQFYSGFSDAFDGHTKPERAEQSRLFKNTGNNRFVDVTEKVGLIDNSWSGDASAIDLNEDGWQDIYILNMQGHDEYYENNAGHSFTRKSREYFPETSWGAMGIKVFDYNNDGRMDIYVTDMHTDMRQELNPSNEKAKISDDYLGSIKLMTDGRHVRGNSFFRNDGDGKFTEVSEQVNVENYWPWGLSVGDLNADGFQDIFVTASMNMRFRYSVNNLLLNDGGKQFIDSEFTLGVEPRLGGKTEKPWFLYYCSDKNKNDRTYNKKSFCRKNTEIYQMYETLGSRSSVIFDLDMDGDLDIVTNEWNWHPMMLVSNLAEKKDIGFLKVKLKGTQSNRDGLGARVTVHVGDQAYTQVYDGKSGYLSQSSYPLYFGLNDAENIDRVDVVWPLGQAQSLTENIKINTQIEITEK